MHAWPKSDRDLTTAEALVKRSWWLVTRPNQERGGGGEMHDARGDRCGLPLLLQLLER